METPFLVAAERRFLFYELQYATAAKTENRSMPAATIADSNVS